MGSPEETNREIAYKDYIFGVSKKKLATRFGVHVDTVRNWIKDEFIRREKALNAWRTMKNLMEDI